VELQAGLAALERAGVSVFAISYDPVAALTDFATRLGITYPLLSDEGGRSIRSLGLLNEQAPAHRLGIAHPGTFTLDEAGRVVDKHFVQGHRVRPAPAAMLERLVESAGVPASAPTSAGGADDTPTLVAEAERDGVRVTAWLGQATYRPWQQLRLHVSLTIAPDLHVYADPAPEGLCAFGIRDRHGERSDRVANPARHPRRTDRAAVFRLRGMRRGNRAVPCDAAAPHAGGGSSGPLPGVRRDSVLPTSHRSTHASAHRTRSCA